MERCIGTTQNKTKTQSTMILDQYRVTGFYADMHHGPLTM
jgi:hypothetical protein